MTNFVMILLSINSHDLSYLVDDNIHYDHFLSYAIFARFIFDDVSTICDDFIMNYLWWYEMFNFDYALLIIYVFSLFYL